MQIVQVWKETSLGIIMKLTISPKYEIKQKLLGQLTVCILLMPGQRLHLYFSYCFPLFPRLRQPYLEVPFWSATGKK